MTNKITVSTALWGKDDTPYLEYLPAFATALQSQRPHNFDVNFSTSRNLRLRVTEIFETYAPAITTDNRLKIHDLPRDVPPDNLTVAQHRFNVIAGDSPDYNAVILLDPDDTIPRNYIQIMAATLDKGADIAVADLHMVNGQGREKAKPYFDVRYPPNRWIQYQDILHANFMGWSNTAVRPSIVHTPHSQRFASLDKVLAPAGDWMMFFPALARGANAVVADTHIYYEQHNGNLSGITRQGPNDIAKAVRLKAAFYRAQAKVEHVPVVGDKVLFLASQFTGMEKRFFTPSQPNGTEEFIAYAGQVKSWLAKTPANGFGWWGIAPPENAL